MAQYSNKEFIYNDVVINRKPDHFTKPKIIAMARVKNLEGKSVYRKVALSSIKEIDNVNYFPLQEGLLENFPGVSEENKPLKEEAADKEVEEVEDEGLTRFNELKAQKAWLKPGLKGEYADLRAKYVK